MRRLVVALLLGCGRSDPPPPAAVVYDEPALPQAPGVEETNAACRTCHSSRYLTGQPRLARKTWNAEIDKMRTVYGAAVDDAAAPKIADYLVQMNGSE